MKQPELSPSCQVPRCLCTSHLQLLPTPARPPQTWGYSMPTSDEAPGTEDQTKVHLSTTLRLLLRHCFESWAALASLPLPATLLSPNAGIVGICYWTPKTFCSQKRSLIDFPLPDKIISPSSTRSHCLQRGAEPGWPSPLLWCSLLSPTPFSLASQKTQGESPCASDIPPPCFSPSASFLLLPPSLCVPVQAQRLHLKLRVPIACRSSWRYEPGSVEP